MRIIAKLLAYMVWVANTPSQRIVWISLMGVHWALWTQHHLGLASLFLGIQLLATLNPRIFNGEPKEIKKPKDRETSLAINNSYETLRRKVNEYKNFNDAQILTKETERFIDIWKDHFKGEHEKHMEIKVYTPFGVNDHIQCIAKAKTEEGIKAIEDVSKAFMPR